MDGLQRSLLEHEERLRVVRGQAEQLDEAIAGGQGLHKVVSATRVLRRELADIYALFQVRLAPPRLPFLSRP
jgi:hypothetical protein